MNGSFSRPWKWNVRKSLVRVSVVPLTKDNGRLTKGARPTALSAPVASHTSMIRCSSSCEAAMSWNYATCLKSTTCPIKPARRALPIRCRPLHLVISTRPCSACVLHQTSPQLLNVCMMSKDSGRPARDANSQGSTCLSPEAPMHQTNDIDRKDQGEHS